MARLSCRRAGVTIGVVRGLPSGTVTFLFTDVEGSTALLRALGGNAYAEELARHRLVLREAIDRHQVWRWIRKVTPSSSRSPRPGAPLRRARGSGGARGRTGRRSHGSPYG